MYRSGNDSCHADLLSGFDLNITQGQRDIAYSSGGPAGATPVGCMTLTGTR